MSSYRILKKVNPSAYVIDLLSDFEISSTFNISDLVAYKSPHFNLDNSLVDLDEPTHEPFFEESHLPPLLATSITFAAEQIDRFRRTKSSPPEMEIADRRYLVCWNSHSESDNT